MAEHQHCNWITTFIYSLDPPRPPPRHRSAAISPHCPALSTHTNTPKEISHTSETKFNNLSRWNVCLIFFPVEMFIVGRRRQHRFSVFVKCLSWCSKSTLSKYTSIGWKTAFSVMWSQLCLLLNAFNFLVVFKLLILYKRTVAMLV